MPDSPPDRLSNNPRSPFFKEDVLKRDIGIRFKGVEKTNVEEYCVSEGWIRVEVGKTKDRYGNPMTIKLIGTVEPYFKDQKTAPPAKAEPAQKSETAKPGGPPAKAEKPATADKSPKAKSVKPETKKKNKKKKK
jgi:Protein of unknown function (DUF3297)